LGKEIIKDKKFDEERALYGRRALRLENVAFDGAADGESAVKECADIEAVGCYCNLRYPFWHCKNLKIDGCDLTENCRAALWYSENIQISSSKLFGIKALRECRSASLYGCDIRSPEFGWSVNGLTLTGGRAEGEYFLLRSENILLDGVDFTGKYSFQYIKNARIKNCTLNSKDAFWHAKNVVVENCEVNGEYLGWYSHNVTFVNCRITGTQPLCYCRGLKLISCTMEGCDLAFEKSEAEAEILSGIVSVKNPYKGVIRAISVGEIIRDDPKACGKVLVME